jgi:hypothetical protein
VRWLLLIMAIGLCSIGVAESYSITFTWKHSISWNGTGEYVLKQATGTNSLFSEVARTTGTNITIIVQPALLRWHVTYRNASGESSPSTEIPFPPLFDLSPSPRTAVVIRP